MGGPKFITFTGADDRTDVGRMVSLGKRYPIEWGILFSPKRQGLDVRYPCGNKLSAFWWADLRRSAHLCGEHARRIVAGDDPDVPVDLSYCDRIQINHRAPLPAPVSRFARDWGVRRAIIQCRAAFPAHSGGVDLLYDCSGGRGAVPSSWPFHPGYFVGYAGGIGPANVLDVIESIRPNGPYWLDMESGVRTDDWFDLDKVEAVCRAVYATPSTLMAREENGR